MQIVIWKIFKQGQDKFYRYPTLRLPVAQHEVDETSEHQPIVFRGYLQTFAPQRWIVSAFIDHKLT